MNSSDMDFPVSRTFWESDAQHEERRKSVQRLIIKENEKRKEGRRLSEELDRLHELKVVLIALVTFYASYDGGAGYEIHYGQDVQRIDRRIEEIQSRRVKLWRDIKEIANKRATLE